MADDSTVDVDESAVRSRAAPTVVDISAPDLWRNPRFWSMFAAGLRREGLPERLCASVEAWLKESPVDDYQGFRTLAERRAAALDASDRQALAATLDRLDAVIRLNQTCYLRDTPEQSRVVQWPNNPAVKARDPASYFDIHEDYCYRHAHRFISKSTPIGSAGSCFALRIAHQLQSWGYNYVIEEDDLPEDFPVDRLSETSYRMAPARMGTLFNVPSMRQMVERAFGEASTEPLISRDLAGRVRDPFRTANVQESIEAYEADRRRHDAALNRALSRCEVFILTLGLTEAWKFAHSDEFTSVSPWKIDPTLLRRHEVTVEENVAELERLWDVYSRHKPGVKLIVSVSPVPLNKTFSQDHHVVTANAYSKATLRVAAEAFVRNHPTDVFYLPSYEIVTYGARNPWEPDMRHVSAEAVARVMRLFQKIFLVDQSSLPLAGHTPPPPPKAGWLGVAARRAAGPLLPAIRRVRRSMRRS